MTVEYDDGVPTAHNKHKPPGKFVTRRERPRGFYYGERRIPVGFMRVSEMTAMTEFLEDR